MKKKYEAKAIAIREESEQIYVSDKHYLKCLSKALTQDDKNEQEYNQENKSAVSQIIGTYGSVGIYFLQRVTSLQESYNKPLPDDMRQFQITLEHFSREHDDLVLENIERLEQKSRLLKNSADQVIEGLDAKIMMEEIMIR